MQRWEHKTHFLERDNKAAAQRVTFTVIPAFECGITCLHTSKRKNLMNGHKPKKKEEEKEPRGELPIDPT